MGDLELVQTLPKKVGRLWNVAWHPTKDLFASCGEDTNIRLWAKDGSKYSNVVVLSGGHTRTIRQVAWSESGSRLASASFDGTTSIWDRKSANQYEHNMALEGHETEIKSVAWSMQSNILATCGRDKSVLVWEYVDEDDLFECAAVFNSHSQDVKKVVFHPTRILVASASYDNTIQMFEKLANTDWENIAVLESHESTVWSLSFDNSGHRLVSCSDDRTVKIWQEYEAGNAENISLIDGHPTWKCVCTLSGYHTRPVYDVDWCKSTGLIATACGDDAIRIFQENETSSRNAPSFSLIASVDRAHSEDINCVAWHPNGDTLLSCSDDGSIKIWKFSRKD